ncbi:MAG: T9SS type A sorting domain-containing protein, partial [Saprospiraceae bacterium]|nr:T9SS type A sorting domain-containing protein [Saprospiraceae bacterium]
GPSDPSLLYICTAPLEGEPAKVLRTSNGNTWQVMEGLPDRIAMDVAIHPIDSRIAYVVFSGYNTKHVFKTVDDGQTWTSIDSNLPDISVNTIFLDPAQPEHIYLGTDIGVFYSLDQGASWIPFNQGMPEAVMAMDLSISPSNRKLRVATHGNGVYQTDLIFETTSRQPAWVTEAALKIFPNPVRQDLNLTIELEENFSGHVSVYNLAGQPAMAPVARQFSSGKQNIRLPVAMLPSGMYTCVLEGKTNDGQPVRIAKKFMKQ